MQNGGKGLSSIILAESQGVLVKMLMTLEPHCIFQSWGRLHANVINYNYNYFEIS